MVIIGIPSNGPDLSDTVSQHFGHCKYFVGVEVLSDKTFTKSFSFENVGHKGCMEPIAKLKDRNVSDMIIMGIGGRPYAFAIQNKIDLYIGINESIQNNIELYLKGTLKSLNAPSCQHHEHGHENGHTCNH